MVKINYFLLIPTKLTHLFLVLEGVPRVNLSKANEKD